ncbi:MAG TPA: ABC transporter substrate-binding protein [Acidimicrobiales bacterium]|jgi:branched-chain amino acid transport system substrate-binding protein|nr:ABC transporter substrate-binding protein [Acidimicrobiales bacterium]
MHYLKRTAALAASSVALCALATGAFGDPAGASSVSTIKIGILVPQTGSQAGAFNEDVLGAQARVAAVNAAGGIRGHKVQLVVADDQYTTQGSFTGAQSLVADGVVGVIGAEGTIVGAAEQYLSQNHIPIATSAGVPAEMVDPNVFSPLGGAGPDVPPGKSLGKFLLGVNVHKIAGLAWGNVASTVAHMQNGLSSTASVGIQTVLTDLSSSPATVDYAPIAAKLQASGAQSLIFFATNTANTDLAVALHQQNVHIRPVWSTIVLDGSILTDPHESAYEGSYVQSWFAPPSLKTPAVSQFVSTVKKYSPSVYPGYEVQYGYVLADELITGAQKAGSTITGATIYSALRKTKAYAGAGLTPKPINFTKPMTTPQNVQNCYWYVKIQNRNFVTPSQNPVC